MQKSEESFLDGFLVFDVKNLQTPAEVAQWLGDGGLASWHNGFLAFSKGEKKLSDVQGKDIKTLFSEKVSDIEGVVGYLMEVGLWRCSNGLLLEEVSIEREDRGFFCQRWSLHTDKSTDGGNTKCYKCYYREAKTQPITRGDKGLFRGKLSSIEVIVPDRRFNIFITTGSKE